MFVEKLTVFGFKSFNSKISLTFDKGISGVIGPNGCGKSNIVDAMRWVLGEQSHKQLRGSKMEDVIFNGARSEKPMSIAQVELTLNNDRGALPVDYTTVTVGRRLFRSGQSEYLINGNVVRLKDIRDLFLDTGMGSHAYSVIERQMVDNILSDNTGHRRFLFEEAAGIMKYKTRKKEALSKLDATERDLLRVNDIITEVERQVNSLKRQVGKARRYRELMGTIRDLDLGLAQVERRRWVARIQELDGRYRVTLEEAESAETRVNALEADLQSLHLAVLEEERRLQAAREELADVDDDLGRSNSQVMVLRERLSATRRKIQESKDHQVRLADRLERNRTAEAALMARLEELESLESGERTRLDEREALLRTVEEEVRGLRARLAEAERERSRLNEERVRAEGAVTSLTERARELETRLAETETAHAEATARAEDQRAALEAARANAERARERLAAAEETLALLETEKHNHASRLEILHRELGDRRESEAAARSRLETLESLQESYEGFAPGVRALVAGGERSDGVLGTLSDLVRVPGEWVKALEPALTSAWQYVVVPDTDTARSLVGRLTRDELGYASLVSLDRVPDAPSPDGGLRRASETVETDDAYRPLLRYLLGDLVLVDDLDEALAVVREGRAERAATRTGEFVDRIRVSGGAGGPAGAELLEREEALERCRKEIAGLGASLAELTSREANLREERETLTLRARRAGEELAAARSAAEALGREEHELAVRVQHDEERAAALAGTREKLRGELNASREETARLEETLRTTADGATRAGEAHAASAAALADAEARRETALSAVHELKLSWARLEGELSDARSRRDQLAAEHAELEADGERTAREEREAMEAEVTIQAELEELAQRIEELHGLREARQAVVTERERDKSEASAREQQDQDKVREERRKANDARRVAHEAEVELTRLRGDLEHLELRLREEYEVRPEELDALETGELPEDASTQLIELKDRLRRLGPVNLLAVEEYEEKATRFEFMSSQRDDLLQAKDVLVRTINEINKKASGMFLETFAEVQANFQKTFQVLFQGGECSLELTGDDPLEADIDVTARPRGKRPQSIAMLSSGERALTAIALLFAIYLVKPSPFCILDEVDAPLDDANIDRFVAMIKEFSKRTQFIMITHNKKTMEAADCLYGVTMQRPGVSTVVSVKLDGGSQSAEAKAALAGAEEEAKAARRAAAREEEERESEAPAEPAAS